MNDFIQLNQGGQDDLKHIGFTGSNHTWIQTEILNHGTSIPPMGFSLHTSTYSVFWLEVCYYQYKYWWKMYDLYCPVVLYCYSFVPVLVEKQLQSFRSCLSSPSVHPPYWSSGLEPIRAGISSSALLAHYHAPIDSPWQERHTDFVQTGRCLTSVTWTLLGGKWLLSKCRKLVATVWWCVMLVVMCG